MSDSPAAATPYEVLGVHADVSQEELRRAYRRRLRATHPDTGGSASQFYDVQLAWERVGEPDARAAYDRGHASPVLTGEPRPAGTATSGAGVFRGPSGGHTVRARSYGYPGGASRERYVALMREWLGRGNSVEDLFEPGLVRSAPQEIRRHLARALAEEATARAVSTLGIGFTVWNDVDPGPKASDKIDHVVLGPAGLFAIESDDWGAPVRVARGELVGETVDPRTEPLHTLERNARVLARSLRVRFQALIVVVPDDDLAEAIERVDRGRHTPIIIVRRSLLPRVLRDGASGSDRASVDRAFELRTQLQQGIRFV